MVLRHPLVAEAVVVVRDEVGGPRLVGYVVPVAGRVVTREELSRHVLQSLPDYMVPSTFTFLQRLPRKESGKIDRTLLGPSSSTPSSANPVADLSESQLDRLLADLMPDPPTALRGHDVRHD